MATSDYLRQQALCVMQHAPPLQQSPATSDVALVEPTNARAAMIIKRYFIVLISVVMICSLATSGEPSRQTTPARGGGTGGLFGRGDNCAA